MKKIKFRVWNNKAGKMFSVDKMIWDFQGECLPLSQDSYLVYSPDDILMQFTGAKDEAGIDIYEGDIVRGDDEFQGVITWDEEGCCFYARDGLDNLGLREFREGELRVVANIYEVPNPDSDVL